MFVISELEKKYGWDKLNSWRILLLNAGGQSQRMPSASVLGKIFGALPVGDPMYQMLDIKLASYLPFVKRMAPGIFHGPSDTIEVYDLGKVTEGAPSWDFKQAGFTALAHPSTLKIGTGHGVYVLEGNGVTKHSVEQRVCLEVLQKPSVETMRVKNAVVSDSNREDTDKDFVYTDSAFFFDYDVAKKLMEFYRKEMPLNCEIDAYGDFLQALGPKATAAYTKDTKNVGTVENNLVAMREKIYHLLKGTPLTVVALNESEFHHFGTIAECLDHFCSGDHLGKTMNFKKWVSGKVTSSSMNNDVDDGPTKPKKAKVQDEGQDILGCVMMSALHKNSTVHNRCIIEYCNFEIPVDVGNNCLISNCEVKAQDVNNRDKLTCPSSTFMHTVPLSFQGKTKYATVLFANDDNLKKKSPLKEAGELTYFGKSLKEVFADAGIILNADTFTNDDNSAASLWTMKLFPLMDTMSWSFLSAIKQVEALRNGSKWPTTNEPRVSMADIMKMKDVSTMLEYRNKLKALISE